MFRAQRRATPSLIPDPARGPLSGMHVVVCNWRDSSHPQAGGAEHYTEQVASQFAGMGARVTYLTARSKGAARVEARPWGRIVRLGGTLTTYPLALGWLALHRRSIDAVLDSQNGIPYLSPVAVGARVPAILLVHHVHQHQFDTYLPRPLNLVGRFMEKQVSSWVYGSRPICVVSPSTRASVRRQLKFKGPIFIVPNGLTRPTRPARATRSAQPTIVSVGRLVPHKRLELLVEAMAELVAARPGLVLHMVGEGESRATLERLAAELKVGSSVVFHGRLSDLERDQLVGRAWLTVNPSGGEGWGLSVIEAAALGVPAVAFRVAGLEDSVRPGETGWLVEPGQSLAQVVATALDTLADPEVAARWGDRARKWASSFTWGYAAEHIAEVFAGEMERIAHRYDERRVVRDSATVVALSASRADPERLGRLRTTDRVRLDPIEQRVELLLSGADEIDAGRALTRIGIDPSETYWARLARYRDHLGWQSRSDYVIRREDLVSTVGRGPGSSLDGTAVVDLTEICRDGSATDGSTRWHRT